MSSKKFFQKIVNWELWNFYVLYLPISPVWLWYCLRSRSFWYFSSSNPTITFGGFEGEGKKEMYDQLPTELVPRTIYIMHDLPYENVERIVNEAGFSFPFIVKPDVGMKGILFRKIDNADQLRKYHEKVPVEYIVQDLVDLPVEVSVFYYRHPAEKKGIVSGFIHKELLQVKGDGQSTLRQLVEQHPRAKFRMEEMGHRHGHRFDRVIPEGEIFYLSYAGNHNRGAQFTNLHNEINEVMHQVFDELSHKTRFYYGRYDIKTTSIEDLQQGKNFLILEFNGCGAEPNHIYDCGMSLWKAYGVILEHWKALYRISRHNHKNGTPYWSFKKGWNFLKESGRHFKMLEKYD
ncbi:MAG TPA: hypothetical protein PLO70_11350 [Chitinophagaceae bacterium]|nr:hypothetical protein [Chitinophagaceae bacterium]HQV86469.1 hypothetical protein [Chitinophagaceae bacterium]HQZ75107.1 hypothetical protein [Chitinophagaceae bacterium]